MTGLVTITTTTHPFAITMYAFAIILGFGHLVGLVPDTATEEMLPESVFNLWQAIHFMGPLLMVGGAIAARREAVPTRSLSAEALGCIMFATTKGTYLYSLFLYYGLDRGVATQVMSAGLACACVARAVVIWVELSRITCQSRQNVSSEDALHREG